MSTGPKCRRCWESTEECSVCKGDGTYWHPFVGRSDCTECNGTGYLCAANDHGKWWKG
jgi:hypothetical protein